MSYRLGRHYLLKIKDMLEDLKGDAAVKKIPDKVDKIDAVIAIVMELI